MRFCPRGFCPRGVMSLSSPNQVSFPAAQPESNCYSCIITAPEIKSLSLLSGNLLHFKAGFQMLLQLGLPYAFLWP